MDPLRGDLLYRALSPSKQHEGARNVARSSGNIRCGQRYIRLSFRASSERRPYDQLSESPGHRRGRGRSADTRRVQAAVPARAMLVGLCHTRPCSTESGERNMAPRPIISRSSSDGCVPRSSGRTVHATSRPSGKSAIASPAHRAMRVPDVTCRHILAAIDGSADARRARDRQRRRHLSRLTVGMGLAAVSRYCSGSKTVAIFVGRNRPCSNGWSS